MNYVKESTKIRQVMDIGVLCQSSLVEIHPHDFLTEESHHARNFSEFKKNTRFCLSNSRAPSACVSSIQVKTWHSWLFLTNSNPKIWKSIVDTMRQREAYGSAEFEKYKLTILLCAFSSPPSSESKSWICEKYPWKITSSHPKAKVCYRYVWDRQSESEFWKENLRVWKKWIFESEKVRNMKQEIRNKKKPPMA